MIQSDFKNLDRKSRSNDDSNLISNEIWLKVDLIALAYPGSTSAPIAVVKCLLEKLKFSVCQNEIFFQVHFLSYVCNF